MTTTISQRPYEPAPEGFARRFVIDGWRGIERYYGARTDIMSRWLHESGGSRLKALRRRYMRGDVSALEEAMRPMTTAEMFADLATRKADGKKRLAAFEDVSALEEVGT